MSHKKQETNYKNKWAFLIVAIDDRIGAALFISFTNNSQKRYGLPSDDIHWLQSNTKKKFKVQILQEPWTTVW